MKRYPGTLVISHDREFLDAVTNVTIHIDHGTWSVMAATTAPSEDLRAEQLAIQQASFSKQQEKIAHLQSFINRFKAKASKAKQAQSWPRRWNAWKPYRFWPMPNLLLPLMNRARPNPMLAMEDASFAIHHRQMPRQAIPPTIIVEHVNRSVLAGQRIGILGANGQGKSTLVKTIAQTLCRV